MEAIKYSYSCSHTNTFHGEPVYATVCAIQLFLLPSYKTACIKHFLFDCFCTYCWACLHSKGLCLIKAITVNLLYLLLFFSLLPLSTRNIHKELLPSQDVLYLPKLAVGSFILSTKKIRRDFLQLEHQNSSEPEGGWSWAMPALAAPPPSFWHMHKKGRDFQMQAFPHEGRKLKWTSLQWGKILVDSLTDLWFWMGYGHPSPLPMIDPTLGLRLGLTWLDGRDLQFLPVLHWIPLLSWWGAIYVQHP